MPKQEHSYFSDFWHEIGARQWNHEKRLYFCALCEECWPENLEHHLEVDRIVPGNDGPGYTLDNCQLVCPSCNKIKGNNPRPHEVKEKIRRERGRRFAMRNQKRLA